VIVTLTLSLSLTLDSCSTDSETEEITNQEYYDNLKILDYSETKIFTNFVERIDMDKLNFIVTNYDKFEELLREEPKGKEV